MELGPEDDYEANKIEITTTLKKSRNTALGCCITTGILITIFVLILGMTLGEIKSPAILGVAVIWIIIAISTILTLLIYKHPSKTRTFSVSDKSIRIMIPNKPIFQINWDQIEAIEIKKIVTGRHIHIIDEALTPMHVYNDMIFTTTDGSQTNYRIDITRDFPKKFCKKIRELLKEYANKMNKGYKYKK
ncbi:MAG: hypothetical protein ACFFD2_20780 [Promethearchaeota archaeon]